MKGNIVADELTTEQKKYIHDWQERYLNAGLSTKPADRFRAERAIAEIYKTIKLETPKMIWALSPYQANIIINTLLHKESFSHNKRIMEAIENDFKNLTCFEDEKDFLNELKKESKVAFQLTHFWGQMDLLWVSFYRYCEMELKVNFPEDLKKKLSILEEIGFSCGWLFPFDTVCVICERPSEIHLTADRSRPHRTDGPCLVFRDGWELYALNGVAVDKEIVMTPAKKLDPKLIITTQNTEVRREIIRKIGAERICKKLNAKTIDKKGNYRLLSINLGLPEDSKALKMKNPSIGVYHIEWVPRTVKTVQEALNFRASSLKHLKGRDWRPSQLT